MSIATRFSSTAAILAVLACAALATASPAAAKVHKIYNDKQAWQLVDKNSDGQISKKEWKWAEKHGYDRLNGVPKKHLSRSEYQSYLDKYLSYRRSQAYRHNDNNRYDGNNGYKPTGQATTSQPWWAQPTYGNRRGESSGGYNGDH